ncbi:hypothetical protein LIA77_08923 [Sarocladium implicatum]|nr:hypothetical protein LIA77_08923 [Sarocladium implicatum]
MPGGCWRRGALQGQPDSSMRLLVSFQNSFSPLNSSARFRCVWPVPFNWLDLAYFARSVLHWLNDLVRDEHVPVQHRLDFSNLATSLRSPCTTTSVLATEANTGVNSDSRLLKTLLSPSCRPGPTWPKPKPLTLTDDWWQTPQTRSTRTTNEASQARVCTMLLCGRTLLSYDMPLSTSVWRTALACHPHDDILSLTIR